MKKITLILVLIFVGVGIWLFLKKPAQPVPEPTTQEAKQILPQSVETNLMASVSNSTPTAHISQSTNSISVDNQINALAATNLEQWKSMIPGLRKSSGFKISEYWDMWQTNLLTGTPVLLEQNGVLKMELMLWKLKCTAR
jgi:hypothetical protein